MVKTGLALAATNAIIYVSSMTVVGGVAIGIGAYVEPAIGGLLGAVCRCAIMWQAGTLTRRSAAVTVLVGSLLAAGLRGVQIPFVESWLSADSTPHLMRGTVIGSAGVLILGALQDLGKLKWLQATPK